MTTISNINRGTVPNDGTGDSAYDWAGKSNDNFDALNSGKAEKDLSNVTDADFKTKADSAGVGASNVYDDVSTMIADANLGADNDGEKVEWLGYYAAGDGGGNYGIYTDGTVGRPTDDGGSIFWTANGYVSAVFDQGFVKPEHWGAYNDLTNATTTLAAINAAYQYAAVTGNLFLKFVGKYLINGSIQAFRHNGSTFQSTGVSLIGVDPEIDNGTLIKTTDLNNPIIVCQKTFNISIENIKFEVDSGVFFPGFTDIVEGNVFPAGMADGRYNPMACIAIDVFDGVLVGGNQYPGLTSFYTDSNGGSSGISINRCSFYASICGVLISPSSGTQLGESIIMRDCNWRFNQYCISIGQDQNRGIECYSGNFTSNQTLATTRVHGKQTAAEFKLSGGLVAGALREIVDISVAFGGTVAISNLHTESVYQIGEIRDTDRGSAIFEGCFLKLEGDNVANNNQHIPINYNSGSKTIFQNCYVGFGTNGITRQPLISDSYYYNCTLDGMINPLANNIRESYYSGSSIVINPIRVSVSDSNNFSTMAITERSTKIADDIYVHDINTIDLNGINVASSTTLVNNGDGTGTITVNDNCFVGDWLINTFRNTILGYVDSINAGVASLTYLPRAATNASGTVTFAHRHEYRYPQAATIAAGIVTVERGNNYEVGMQIRAGRNSVNRILSINGNDLTLATALAYGGAQKVYTHFTNVSDQTISAVTPSSGRLKPENGDIVKSPDGGVLGNTSLIGWKYVDGVWNEIYKDQTLTDSQTLDFPSMPANSHAELTATLTGVTAADYAVVASPQTAIEAGITWSAYISANDTVTIRLLNGTGSIVDPVSVDWNIVATRL